MDAVVFFPGKPQKHLQQKKEVKPWFSKVFYGKSMAELRNNYGKPMKKTWEIYQHLKVKHGKTMEDL